MVLRPHNCLRGRHCVPEGSTGSEVAKGRGQAVASAVVMARGRAPLDADRLRAAFGSRAARRLGSLASREEGLGAS